MPWISYCSGDIINDGVCIPKEALLITIDNQKWFIWQDEFGFKYAPKKNGHLSMEEAKVRRIELSAQAILTLKDADGKMVFELEKLAAGE